MKALALIISLMSVLGLASPREMAEEKPAKFTIGFTPSGDLPVMTRGAQALSSALSKETGVQINTVVAKNYNELLDMVSQKKVDFAFLTSRSFVEAEKKYGVKVLLKKVWQAPYYYSVLLVNEKSKLKKVSDLKGQRIALVDKKSTSGFLYPEVLFKKSGLQEKDFKQVIYSGSHAESVALLEQGKVDVIAVFSDDEEAKQSAWLKFQKGNKIKIRKIWASSPIPNDPFCVRQEFYDKYPKLTHTLMFSLIDVVENLQNNIDVKALLGANGFQPATSRQYDAVREMVEILGPLGE